MTADLFLDRGAAFSPCRKYRYRLWRIWDKARSPLLFCMLNPSTADELANDPTVERCERRSRAMGYGGLVIVNIFAWRSTDPKMLYALADPVGSENDATILAEATKDGLVICGWGKHGALNERGSTVARMLLDNDVQPHALKINADGSPAHPLYIGYDVQPVPFGAPTG